MNLEQICKKMAERGLVIGASGNVSERQGDFFRITASSVRLDSVNNSTIITCGINSDVTPEKASIETGMHRAIYQQRQEVNAIIHANPPYTTLLACSDEIINTSIIPEGALIHVSYVGVFQPGSKELASAVGSASLKSDVIILRNHGVVVIGVSLEEALNRLEYVEFISRLIIMARMSGIKLNEAEFKVI